MKKEFLPGLIGGIIIFLVFLLILTAKIQPLQAQQTERYATFKTELSGFKFLRKIGTGSTPFVFAPLFAETPSANSSDNQVATKEYVDTKISTGGGGVYRMIEMEGDAYLQRTVKGPTCLEEFGVYIYRKEGNRGKIYFTSMTGRKNYIYIGLGNQEEGSWFINTGCRSEGCIVNNNWQYLRDNFYALTFPIIFWDWDTVDRSKSVHFDGRGIGLQDISWGDPDFIIWRTGREFAGNNYGCNREFWLTVSLPKPTGGNPQFINVNLPSNLKIVDSQGGKAKHYFKYVGNYLVSYSIELLDIQRTSAPLNYSAWVDLCGDIDGCFVLIYENNPTSYSSVLPLSWGSHIKYWPETEDWTSNNERKGQDRNRITQHLLRWGNYYLTDGEYVKGNNRGDNSLGISVYNNNPDTNNLQKPVFVIRD